VLDFIERHLGYSPDGGDASFEMMMLVLGVLFMVFGGIYWADRQSKRDTR
jgi:hypothetical protein